MHFHNKNSTRVAYVHAFMLDLYEEKPVSPVKSDSMGTFLAFFGRYWLFFVPRDDIYQTFRNYKNNNMEKD